MSQLYYITKENLQDKDTLFHTIYSNHTINYYFSDDFSCEFYILLARAGFISVSYSQDDILYLLPEIQFEYAVLEFENLYISKKVNKLLKQQKLYKFSLNNSFDEVLKNIELYHQDNWIKQDYLEMLKKLYIHNNYNNNNNNNNFQLISCELFCQETNRIVAGEIGYKIGYTYTSLSGFSNKEKRYNNWGKLQMTLLSQYLEKNNFSFWNLGHPYMQYKLDLGAKVLSRVDFLEKWLRNIGN